jgi:hypothetical protein
MFRSVCDVVISEVIWKQTACILVPRRIYMEAINVSCVMLLTCLCHDTTYTYTVTVFIIDGVPIFVVFLDRLSHENNNTFKQFYYTSLFSIHNMNDYNNQRTCVSSTNHEH